MDLNLQMRISFDTKARFPLKLFEVANDGFLVKWSPDGSSIFVPEEFFEEKVMKYYPGFVQISSFLNFRRLFREYSFDWRIVEGTDNLFEFSHPSFLRGREELLHDIETKRKTFRKSCSRKRYLAPLAASSPQSKQHIRPRRHCRRRRLERSTESFCGSSGSSIPGDLSFTSSATRSNSDFSQAPSVCDLRSRDTSGLSSGLYPSTHVSSALDGVGWWSNFEPNNRLTRQDLRDVLVVYATNELTEDEYLQLLANAAATETNGGEIAPYATAADDTRERSCSQILTVSSPELGPFECRLVSSRFYSGNVSYSDENYQYGYKNYSCTDATNICSLENRIFNSAHANDGVKQNLNLSYDFDLEGGEVSTGQDKHFNSFISSKGDQEIVSRKQEEKFDLACDDFREEKQYWQGGEFYEFRSSVNDLELTSLQPTFTDSFDLPCPNFLHNLETEAMEQPLLMYSDLTPLSAVEFQGNQNVLITGCDNT